VWTRSVNGQALHFYLAGINNQNFLMRDKETGTWWQQINGKAIFGPLKGASLDLVPYDEITFGEWKSEVAGGLVLAPIPKYKKEYDPNWEPDVAKLPVVVTFPGTELKSRDVVVGVEVEGASRCYPWQQLVKQSPVIDHVGGKPVLVAVAGDGKSFRAFISQIDGKDAEFFLKSDPENNASGPTSNPAPPTKADHRTPVKNEAPLSSVPPPAPKSDSNNGAAATSSPVTPASKAAEIPPKPWILVDSATGSEWNFRGCAISGPAAGKCLNRVAILKDYWFDWRNYHPDTTVYKR
jgi:Protein of unknown function (DUF3179)